MRSIRLFLYLALLTGVIYPLFVTLIANLIAPGLSKGSLVESKGKVIGSALIGQKFESSVYFWPRPSAVNYNPLPSGASQLGPSSTKLLAQVAERRLKLKHSNSLIPVPSDLLFASGSGLDPHISPRAARFQMDRILTARGLNTPANSARLNQLIHDTIKARDLRFLGERTLNVLLLNQALDELFGSKKL